MFFKPQNHLKCESCGEKLVYFFELESYKKKAKAEELELHKTIDYQRTEIIVLREEREQLKRRLLEMDNRKEVQNANP